MNLENIDPRKVLNDFVDIMLNNAIFKARVMYRPTGITLDEPGAKVRFDLLSYGDIHIGKCYNAKTLCRWPHKGATRELVPEILYTSYFIVLAFYEIEGNAQGMKFKDIYCAVGKFEGKHPDGSLNFSPTVNFPKKLIALYWAEGLQEEDFHPIEW